MKAGMAQHVHLRIDTGLVIYFCDARSPWGRGTNETQTGYCPVLPKSTDLSKHSSGDLAAVAAALNHHPLSLQQRRVATISGLIQICLNPYDTVKRSDGGGSVSIPGKPMEIGALLLRRLITSTTSSQAIRTISRKCSILL